jgi:hypothetical protein
MYTPEDIKEAHEIPRAKVIFYGEVVEMEGLQVASFFCKDGNEEFVIIASEQAPGNITTSRHEHQEIIDAGEGDFHNGVLTAIKRHVYHHLEDLILPE